MAAEIHIPEGIRFECTGCGNCCLAWPVPVTAEDRERLERLVAGSPAPLMRSLHSSDTRLGGFTHTLEKRPDGRCQFLTEDSRCQLHLDFGPDAKPAMCQLFPYTFNETPGGVYASVSFASSGVLLNSGRLLSDQAELLRQKWELFKRLFPSVSPDWSQLQLVDGQPLDWDSYMKLDGHFLRILADESRGRVDKRLFACSRFLLRNIERGIDLERMPPVESSRTTVDKILVKHLMELYLPDDVFAGGVGELDARALLQELVQAPQVVQLTCGRTRAAPGELKDLILDDLDPASEDLLSRFVYCRVFSKLYFGAGFANLSVITGIHHLAVLVALVRLKVKLIALGGSGVPDFYTVAEIVRALERRLTQVDFSRDTTSVLEVLLTSPERIERLLYLSR